MQATKKQVVTVVHGHLQLQRSEKCVAGLLDRNNFWEGRSGLKDDEGGDSLGKEVLDGRTGRWGDEFATGTLTHWTKATAKAVILQAEVTSPSSGSGGALIRDGINKQSPRPGPDDVPFMGLPNTVRSKSGISCRDRCRRPLPKPCTFRYYGKRPGQLKRPRSFLKSAHSAASRPGKAFAPTMNVGSPCDMSLFPQGARPLTSADRSIECDFFPQLGFFRCQPSIRAPRAEYALVSETRPCERTSINYLRSRGGWGRKGSWRIPPVLVQGEGVDEKLVNFDIQIIYCDDVTHCYSIPDSLGRKSTSN
ncbi:hypothetical protein EVAR_13239_1 [Eumeta japonica]|uniref:Uncharacterized protein n=1 Tax=Eumeta variegata TaxID=151549 RepID=A0A4C1TS99_EUMVA|nr:hypothetical protein EVAR_13239_1 [Eumeta japonica]